MSSTLRYALITPARNEEASIGNTIECVIAQTVRPVRWIIVSDGSTDGTNGIVRRYLGKHPWIGFVSMPEHPGRDFAAKAWCFKTGLAELSWDSFDIVGNLDADLTFDPGYFEFLIGKFSDAPHLGVAGTPFVEDGGVSYNYRFTNIDHVSGACQLFRKECYTSIGGYVPIPSGGIDWVAVTTARMRGWTTRTFTEKTVLHHRKMGTGDRKSSGARFHMGVKDYNRGNSLGWEMLRCIYQMRYKPYVLGAIVLFCGYIWAAFRHEPRLISEELLRFTRREQADRLWKKFRFFLKRK